MLAFFGGLIVLVFPGLNKAPDGSADKHSNEDGEREGQKKGEGDRGG
jgi:hypothetical protein